MRDAGEHGRVGDLVAVEVQDRQHRAVGLRVEEFVRVPAGRRRAGLRLAVADDAGDDQVGIVERRAIGVRQRVAEFAALVDRAGRLRRDVARNAAGKRELLEQPLHSRFVLGDVGVDLAVDAFEIDVGDNRRAAVAGAGDEQDLEVERFDQPVEVRVDEIEAGRRAPVPEQPRLDVLLDQRLAQQRIVEQIDLADRQVVGGAPVGVDQLEFALRKRRCHRCSFQVSPSEPERRLRPSFEFLRASCGVAMTPARLLRPDAAAAFSPILAAGTTGRDKFSQAGGSFGLRLGGKVQPPRAGRGLAAAERRKLTLRMTFGAPVRRSPCAPRALPISAAPGRFRPLFPGRGA